MKRVYILALLISLIAPVACFADPADIRPVTLVRTGEPKVDMIGNLLRAGGLAGYKVYCGTEPDVYPYVFDLGMIPSVADIFEFDLAEYDIPAGDYVCVLTAYSSLGYESSFSDPVDKTIGVGIRRSEVSEAPLSPE